MRAFGNFQNLRPFINIGSIINTSKRPKVISLRKFTIGLVSCWMLPLCLSILYNFAVPIIKIQPSSIITMYPGCPLCNFRSPRDDGDSTPNDIVFGALGVDCQNLYTFCRSLRTCGCRARCVLFVSGCPVEAYKTNTVFFKACQITMEFISNEIPPRAQCPFYLNNYRMKLIAEYIQQIDFHRFLMTDVYDAIFQADPFTSKIKDDHLYVISEEGTFMTHGAAYEWMRQSYAEGDPDPISLMTKPVLNDGEIMGGRRPILVLFAEFLNRFSALPEVPCQFSWDQGTYTLLVYGKFFEKMHVPYEIWNTTKSSISFVIDMAEQIFPPILGEARLPGQSAYYQYIHKYNYNLELRNSAREICYQLNDNDYMPYR